MPYRFKTGKDATREVRRIVHEQIDRAIHELTSDELPRDEVVHQVRKRCKKIRGVLRLARPGLGSVYKTENAWYRDAARRLSDVRDAEVLVETLDGLFEHFGDQVDASEFAPARRALIERRDAAAGRGAELDRAMMAFLAELRLARERVNDWPLKGTGLAVIAEGLRKTYARGRKDMRVAYEKPTDEAFHEWRKRVKYHWYHVRLLKEM